MARKSYFDFKLKYDIAVRVIPRVNGENPYDIIFKILLYIYIYLFSTARSGLEASIFSFCLAHTNHSKINVSYFQRTDRTSNMIRILKTDLNSS